MQIIWLGSGQRFSCSARLSGILARVASFVGVVLLAASALAEPYAARTQVQGYIDEIVETHGFSRMALEEVFTRASKQERIIELMSRPAERRLVWHEYRKILVDEPRVSQGITFWRENEAALERAAEIYGVAPEIIVAIIGVETL